MDTVLAWHAALNEADARRVTSLSTDDVEVGGPRGSARGAEALRDWIGRAGIRLDPLRTFSGRDGAVVVVEQSAAWRSEAGTLSKPQVLASVFRVRDGKVESVVRYPDLTSALDASGLDPSLAR